MMESRRASLITLAVLLLILAIVPTIAQDETYVIATHIPEFGDTQPPADFDDSDDDTLMTLPPASYGVYNFSETDYEAITQAQVDEVVEAVEASTGVAVQVLNQWDDVEESIDALQIINNVPVEGALYTIMLPPQWNRDKALPVVLSGNGAGTSNNDRLWRGGELIMPEIVAGSMQAGKQGLIGALSNAGGLESQGVDEVTMRSVGAFLDFMHENGGDKYNVLTVGGSRGGGTALVWAANPLDLDYEIHTVFAEVPPVLYGSLSENSVLTYPALASIGVLVMHDPTAYRFDSQSYQPSEMLNTLMGVDTVEEADARSPYGLAERLRGKGLMLSAGAKDGFFQLAHFLSFSRHLDDLDIRHGAVVTLASGHLLHDFWGETLFLYLEGLARGTRLPLPSGRFYYIDVDPRQDEQVSLGEFFADNDIEDDPSQLPVTTEFPYRAGRNNPVDVTICGTPGDDVTLSLQSDSGETVYTLAVVLDADECVVDTTAFDLEPGTYTWSMTVNGLAINPRNTPTRDEDGCGMLAVTIIEADQPEPQDTMPFSGDFSYGLEEYSGQTCLPETSGESS